MSIYGIVENRSVGAFPPTFWMRKNDDGVQPCENRERRTREKQFSRRVYSARLKIGIYFLL